MGRRLPNHVMGQGYHGRRAGVVVGMVLVLALGGCSTGDPDSDEPPELGPLDQLFQDIYGSWDEEQSAAQQMRVEEIVARCMAEEGFDYTPVDYSSQSGLSFAPDDLDVEWGTLEFAEQYGYGATTDPYGMTEQQEPSVPQEWVDPNQDYVMALSESAQQAYYTALSGLQNAPEIDGEVVYSWEDAGCQGRAQHEVYESAPGLDDETFTALQADMQTMWESATSDPRMGEVSSAWAACMADAGHPGFAAVEDAASSIYNQLNEIWESAFADLPPTATPDDYVAAQEVSDAQAAELTPLEIELAVADVTCREEVDYDRITREVNIEYQQDFYDAHREELEAWREAALAAGGQQ